MGILKIVMLGNFGVPYSSESQYLRTLQVKLGHTVEPLQEGMVSAEEVEERTLQSDLLFWVHTHGWSTPGKPMREVLKNLRDSKIPSVGYHLDLWVGLDRMQDLDTDPYWGIDHFFTVDKEFADYLNEHKDLPEGYYLKPGVVEDACYIADVPLTKDVVFIGSKGYHPEWPYRPQLIDWLASTYGDRFEHWGGDGLGVVRDEALNDLCAGTKVIIGDSLCKDFKKEYYWSERIYDQIGRGAFMIHPKIKGLSEEFVDAVHLRYYEFGNFKQLQYLIDHYLKSDKEREKIRRQGQAMVKDKCTYTHRLQEMLACIK